MSDFPWHDPWFIASLLGILICIGFICWPRTIDKVDSLVQMGVRIPTPIECVSREGVRIECGLSVPLEYYNFQIENLVRDRIRKLTAADIRSQTEDILRVLNGEILRFLEFQWNGKPGWKVRVTRVEAVKKLNPFPIGTQ